MEAPPIQEEKLSIPARRDQYSRDPTKRNQVAKANIAIVKRHLAKAKAEGQIIQNEDGSWKKTASFKSGPSLLTAVKLEATVRPTARKS